MSFVKDTFDALTGKTAAQASRDAAGIQGRSIDRAIDITEEGIEKGLGFLDPFSSLGTQGVGLSSFLTDPNAQFDFLQSNPLFQLALDNANRVTEQSAAASSRLSAGDTLQRLSENVLLSASPLISDQKNSILDLLNLGTGVAQSQANTSVGGTSNIANLTTSGGNVGASGVVGAANARTQGTQNLLNTGLLAGIAFSDSRLKSNIEKVGMKNGFTIYSWTWNELAETMGLSGDDFGVIAQEILETNPEAVMLNKGFLMVDYDQLGMNDGH